MDIHHLGLLSAAMVDSCWSPPNYLGKTDPRRVECLNALTPVQVVQQSENKIPNAAIPRVNLRK